MKKLLRLLHSCNDIFNLPIIIIAQNYNEDDLKQIKQINNISIYEFVKLGIVGARNALRNIFLKSSYSYLIMLDDDCSISGTKEAGQKYLSQIDENPNCYYEFNKSLLKLFAHQFLHQTGQIYQAIFYCYTQSKKQIPHHLYK